MKAVILAGGYGTRISEETILKPKPMIEIGGLPILWHIMKIYSHYGINDFIICAGYKGYIIKEYFSNYFLHKSDVTFDMRKNNMHIHNNSCEPWKVTIVDTGESSQTGGRLKRVREFIGDETFCFTYGDCLGDVDVNELIKFHKGQKCYATLTTVQPPGRFGSVSQSNNKVTSFQEKLRSNEGWINGGFFVLEKEVFDFIEDDDTSWEIDSLANLTKIGQLSAYNHIGFWSPMDTLRDKFKLEELWNANQAPWKVWE
jgi:glucose-1-phosphate cytidylyltransferase